LISLLLGSALAPRPAAGQDQTGAPRYRGSMGTVTVGDRQLYRISLRPELPLGRLGVALDLELFVDEDGDLSATGWEFDTGTAAFDSFLRKIYYLRYGQPQDPTYVRVGALDNVTLGYGLIVSDYRNTLEYPGVKKVGAQFGRRDLAGSGIGLEGFVNNLQDLNQGGGLIGLRLSRRAIGNLELGLSYVVDLDQYAGLLDTDGDGFPDVVDAFPGNKDLALDNDRDGVADGVDNDDDNDGAIDVDAGAGLPDDVVASLIGLSDSHGDGIFPVDRAVSRTTPFNRDRVKRDRLAMLGLDAAYPLAERERLALKLYGQFALLLDDDDALTAADAAEQGIAPGNRKAKGWGLAAPGLWLQAGPLTGQLELRHFRDDFNAGYFDNLYEVDRARLDPASGQARPKDANLARGESVSGLFGKAGAELAGLVHASASYQYLAGADDPQQQLIAGARLTDQLMARVPRLTEARAYYQKNYIGARLNQDGDPGSEDGFFESTEDAFYGYLLGLRLSGGVSVLWDTRYVFAREADQSLERRKLMTIETVFDF
jgi:hypothetical protein